MSLKSKQRSRSESRSQQQRQQLTQLDNNLQHADIQRHINLLKDHDQQQNPTYTSSSSSSHIIGGSTQQLRRKTSAELISEAKEALANGGSAWEVGFQSTQRAKGITLRLVNTRRPVTPHESGRSLYGNVSIAGRPPSAFSMRYLQNEGIGGGTTNKHNTWLEAMPNEPPPPSQPATRNRRSNSLDSQCAVQRILGMHQQPSSSSKAVEKCHNFSSQMEREIMPKTLPRKLPSIVVNGKAIGPKTDEHFSKDKDKMQRGMNDTINAICSRKLTSRNCDVLAQSTTQKLVELLKEHAGLKNCTEETVNHINSILVELYNRVRKNDKSFKKGLILGGLYGLVEATSPKILLGVARVVLALRVTGSNLTGACKLIYKVARNEQNDQYYYDNNILELLIEGLGCASPLEDPEACIYGYGAIRFLTSSNNANNNRDEEPDSRDSKFQIIRPNVEPNDWDLPPKPATAPHQTESSSCNNNDRKRFRKQNDLVERLSQHGAIQLMVLHLQILNEAAAVEKLHGPPLHSLYQLSMALRALANVHHQHHQTMAELDDNNLDGNARNMPQNESIQLEMACPHLIRAAEVSMGELEVQSNIVRTLSVLSEDENCCHVLATFTERIGMLLGPCCELLKTQPDKILGLLSRIGYILGNIMAKYDYARNGFYGNDAAMEYLLNILELCSNQPLTLKSSLGDTIIDVLIKMIRVIANMSVNMEVGCSLGSAKILGYLLLNLLQTNNRIKSMKIDIDLQELIHATLGALHNLCFYQDTTNTHQEIPAVAASNIQDTSLLAVVPHITSELLQTLRIFQLEESTLIEAERVLGNMTRNQVARDRFCNENGIQVILQRLSQHTDGSYEMKACAIGILINLLGDAHNRGAFIENEGAQILLHILGAVLEVGDWLVAAIVCQALWNLLADHPHGNRNETTENGCDHDLQETLNEICNLLIVYLNKGNPKMAEEQCYENNPTLWDEFALIANDLVERIQSSNGQQDSNIVSTSSDDDDDDDAHVHIL